jgi:hypothetical protein
MAYDNPGYRPSGAYRASKNDSANFGIFFLGPPGVYDHINNSRADTPYLRGSSLFTIDTSKTQWILETTSRAGWGSSRLDQLQSFPTMVSNHTLPPERGHNSDKRCHELRATGHVT